MSASGSSLLMQLSTPVCVLRGPRYLVELVNPPCCEVWGCRPEDAVGRSLMDVRPDEAVRPYKDLLDGVLRTGERATLRQALWSMLPPAGETPHRPDETAPALARRYSEALGVNPGRAQ